jgi:hypothetical protein
VSGKLQTVHVRVTDAATGKPTPARIRFTDAGGTYYAPFGRLAKFATGVGEDVGGNVLLGDEPHAYIDGACEIALPPGPIHVAIDKGPEYRPLREEIDLLPGKLALRFVIERWADLRAEGWYSGDTRSHFLSPHAALLEGAAEDLTVVNLLAEECVLPSAGGGNYRTISNILAFSGQEPALERDGHLVVVNTMNVQSLDQLLLLNCHRAVFPLSAGGPGNSDTWTLADWCDQCHRKGGLVIGEGFFGAPPKFPRGELLADLVLGKVDALQMDGFENPEVDRELGQEPLLQAWYQWLDCGFRTPLVGGSGKDCNLTVLGSPRTYALLLPDQPFTYRNWIEAVRAGRTFVSNGPLLRFTVNGQPSGAVLDLPATASRVTVRAEVRSLAPLHRLEVVANNEVVAGADASGEPAAASVEAEVPLPRGGWLAARCWGPYDDAREQWHAAQSSPVYVQVEGRPPAPNPAALAALAESLQKGQREAAERGAGTDLRQRLDRIFEEARAVLLARQQAHLPAPGPTEG